jgi:hypothetical protein
LNNTLLNDQWVIEEVRGIKKFLEFNENESTMYENLWHTAKAGLRENFMAMSAYIKNTEKSQINNLMLPHKLLEKEQAKCKTSRKRETIKISTKIKQTIQRIIGEKVSPLLKKKHQD